MYGKFSFEFDLSKLYFSSKDFLKSLRGDETFLLIFFSNVTKLFDSISSSDTIFCCLVVCRFFGGCFATTSSKNSGSTCLGVFAILPNSDLSVTETVAETVTFDPSTHAKCDYKDPNGVICGKICKKRGLNTHKASHARNANK